MTFVLRKMCLGQDVIYVSDPVLAPRGNAHTLRQDMATFQHAIFSINVGNLQWLIAIATIGATSTNSIDAVLFDLLVTAEYQSILVTTLDSM